MDTDAMSENTSKISYQYDIFSNIPGVACAIASAILAVQCNVAAFYLDFEVDSGFAEARAYPESPIRGFHIA